MMLLYRLTCRSSNQQGICKIVSRKDIFPITSTSTSTLPTTSTLHQQRKEKKSQHDIFCNSVRQYCNYIGNLQKPQQYQQYPQWLSYLSMSSLTPSYYYYYYYNYNDCSNNRYNVQPIKINIRLFSSNNRYNTNNKDKKKSNNNNNKKRIIKIGTKPNEEQYKSKIPMPNQNIEKRLGQLQNELQIKYREGLYNEAIDIGIQLLKETEDHFIIKDNDTTDTTNSTTTTNNNNYHPAIATAYNNLGLLYKIQGNYIVSYNNYNKALEIYKHTVGIDHSSYATTLHNIGNLYRTQIHLDTELRVTDRLTLLDTSIDYLSQSYSIRCNELGSHHPHTVSSRSSWGSALATQILHYYKVTTMKTSNLIQKKFYLSLLPEHITEQSWNIAENHLRSALITSINNPRGRTIQGQQQQGQQQNSINSSTMKTATIEDDNEASTKVIDIKNIRTLSAAAAAQNLAIFLKCRATTLSGRNTITDFNEEIDTTIDNSTTNTESTTGTDISTTTNIDTAATTTTTTPSTNASNHIDIYEKKSNNDAMTEIEKKMTIKEDIEQTTKNNKNNNNNNDNKNKDEDDQDDKLNDLVDTYFKNEHEKIQHAKVYENLLFTEAYNIYQQIFIVQKELIQSNNHPDVYTTKYNFAELLEAMNRIDEANTIRTEILDTYDPPSLDIITNPDTDVVVVVDSTK